MVWLVCLEAVTTYWWHYKIMSSLYQCIYICFLLQLNKTCWKFQVKINLTLYLTLHYSILQIRNTIALYSEGTLGLKKKKLFALFQLPPILENIIFFLYSILHS